MLAGKLQNWRELMNPDWLTDGRINLYSHCRAHLEGIDCQLYPLQRKKYFFFFLAPSLSKHNFLFLSKRLLSPRGKSRSTAIKTFFFFCSHVCILYKEIPVILIHVFHLIGTLTKVFLPVWFFFSGVRLKAAGGDKGKGHGDLKNAGRENGNNSDGTTTNATTVSTTLTTTIAKQQQKQNNNKSKTTIAKR